MGHDRRNCHTPRTPGDVTLESLNLDTVEYGFLMAARYAFTSFSERSDSPWVSIIISSDCFFPGPHHAEAMRRAIKLINEMRGSRKSTLRFSNPRCQDCAQIVTEHERHFIQLVQHARRGQHSRMASSAMLLCEGNPIENVMMAAREFCLMLPSVIEVQSTVSV